MSVSLPASVARAELSLAGTWTLVAADVLHADGTRGRDYGAAPKGLLLNDAQGHYSLQNRADAHVRVERRRTKLPRTGAAGRKHPDLGLASAEITWSKRQTVAVRSSV
jgi:Lipocalin-like domain